mmetsp:Transcript_104543/g.305211  ORF Transcript_104543/g.305211 Transcript_104543/m.305211 type:complete len:324 (+) Transcript_104543:1787-2758(+)
MTSLSQRSCRESVTCPRSGRRGAPSRPGRTRKGSCWRWARPQPWQPASPRLAGAASARATTGRRASTHRSAAPSSVRWPATSTAQLLKGALWSSVHRTRLAGAARAWELAGAGLRPPRPSSRSSARRPARPRSRSRRWAARSGSGEELRCRGGGVPLPGRRSPLPRRGAAAPRLEGGLTQSAKATSRGLHLPALHPEGGSAGKVRQPRMWGPVCTLPALQTHQQRNAQQGLSREGEGSARSSLSPHAWQRLPPQKQAGVRPGRLLRKCCTSKAERQPRKRRVSRAEPQLSLRSPPLCRVGQACPAELRWSALPRQAPAAESQS